MAIKEFYQSIMKANIGFALFHKLLITVTATTALIAENYLVDLQYIVRANGIEMRLTYSSPLKNDKIIALKSHHKKIYLTLLDVKHPIELFPSMKPDSPISSVVIDDFDGSTQLAFMFKQPIIDYGIMNTPINNESKLFIYLSSSKNLVNLDTQFHQTKLQLPSFPEYKVQVFDTAFSQARDELGANAIFKYNNKFYITNYLDEYTETPISVFVKDVQGEEVKQEKIIKNLNLITTNTEKKKEQNSTEEFDPLLKQLYNHLPNTPLTPPTPVLQLAPKQYAIESNKTAIISQTEHKTNGRSAKEIPMEPIYETPLKRFAEPQVAMIIQNDYQVSSHVSDDFSILNQVGFEPSIGFPKENSSDIPEIVEWIDHEIFEHMEETELGWQSPKELNVPAFKRKELPQSELDKKQWYHIKNNYKDKTNPGKRVTSNMDGVPIYVDGKMMGKTPLNGAIKIQPGWHQVSGFSPVFAQIVADGGLYELGADPITRNNQLFGSKMIYVEIGKVTVVNLKFNKIDPEPTKKWIQNAGGMMIGFPVIMAMFGFITWGII